MYYWERFLDEDQILDHLRAPDSGLHECRGGEGVEGMIATYPSYRCRDYHAYTNGSCWGYTTDEVIQSLLDSGFIERNEHGSLSLTKKTKFQMIEAKHREMLARLEQSHDDFTDKLAAIRAKYAADIKKADEEDMAVLRAALREDDNAQ